MAGMFVHNNQLLLQQNVQIVFILSRIQTELIVIQELVLILIIVVLILIVNMIQPHLQKPLVQVEVPVMGIKVGLLAA